MPLPLMAASTPQKYMTDCMLHYINEDDYYTAFEVPEALSEQDLIAQIKKKRKYPNRLIHKQDEIDSFINVNQIQESLLKSDKDRFLVYKWECKAMGHKASYVSRGVGGAVRWVQLQHKANQPVLDSRRRCRPGVNNTSTILMDLFAIY